MPNDMDLEMPVVDGWEATRQLKSDPVTALIPIVVISGRADDESMARAKAAGCDAYCVKPCPPDVLLATIVQLVSRPPRVADPATPLTAATPLPGVESDDAAGKAPA